VQAPVTEGAATEGGPRLSRLAIARIAIGALILLRTTPILSPLHILFLGDTSPMLGWPEHGFSFAWLAPGAIEALCVLRTIGAAALMLGLWAAPGGILVAASGLLVAAQSPFGAPATLQLLYESAMLLGISDASSVLALKPTARRCPRSSVWLLQAFVASVYAWAGLFKWRLDWLDGRTLAVLHDSGAIEGAFSDWLLATPSSRALVACAVAAFETIAGPLLLWRRTRRWVLVLAFAFHLALQASARPDFLGLAMMVLLVSFID
jgi:hypothetical protein